MNISLYLFLHYMELYNSMLMLALYNIMLINVVVAKQIEQIRLYIINQTW